MAIVWNDGEKYFTKKGAFAFAAHEYQTDIGVVAVLFTCDTAFLWASDAGTEQEDRWAVDEVKDFVRRNMSGAFPVNYNEYIPIIDYGEEDVKMSVAEKYGLKDYADDIKERLKSLADYAVERDTPTVAK